MDREADGVATMSHAPPLSYAPRRRRWMPRWVKRSAVLIALLGIIATAWRFWPCRLAPAALRIWYWERECMNFDPPAGSVAFEAMPPGLAKPVTGRPFVDGDDPEVVALGVVPVRQSVERYPICYIRYLQATGSRLWTAVVFCHRLVSPAGHGRLVIVQYPLDEENGVGDALDEFMSSRVLDRGSGGKMPVLRRLENRRRFIDWMGIDPLPMPTRMYAGQTDPQDASHFTIEFSVAGRRPRHPRWTAR